MAHVKASVRLLGWSSELPDASDERVAERAQLARDITESPAMHRIVEFLGHAKGLGLDVSDPAVIERAISAGTKAHADHERAVAAATSYRALRVAHGGRHVALVYYMRSGDRVKIGTSTSLKKRLANISPDGVLVVEPGDRAAESARHEQFQSLRIRGEWFRLAGGLAEHIVTLRERFEREVGNPFEAWLDRHILNAHMTPKRVDATSIGSFRRVPHEVIALPEQDLPEDASELLSAAELARALGKRPQTIDQWRRAGRIWPAAQTASHRKLYRLSEALQAPRHFAA